MNIVFTATAYPPSTGGAQFYLHMLAVQLQQRHLISAITFWDHHRTDWLLGTTLRGPNARDYEMDGVTVHRLGFSRAEKLQMLPFVAGYYALMPVAARQIANIIQPKIAAFTANADIIHNIRIGREPLSLASLHHARKSGIPFVLTPVHHPRWKGWRYRVYNRLYGEADAIIALTEAEKRILLELGVKEERIFITGMGPVLAQQANPEAFLARHGIRSPVILFLGQHYPYKGFLQVLQSAPLVWKKIPEAEFVFIGPPVGNSETYFTQNADPRIHRLGHVSLQEKTDALAACTLLCVPSLQESFGGVYTEAWSFHKPVIGCPIPAVQDVIADGIDGYLVDQQPEAVAERIIFLLEHPSQATQMGKAGYQKVYQRYAWDRLAELTETIYQKLL